MEKEDYRIQVYSGEAFDILYPVNIYIKDIAHALSLICRYNGHCNQFYSVAEHSVIISDCASEENAMWGLLHDAAEAYIGDIPRPVKKLINKFNILEKSILDHIAYKFNLYPKHIPDEILRLDDAIIATEYIDLMKQRDFNWNFTVEPLDVSIHCWSPEQAEEEFLKRFIDLHDLTISYLRKKGE